MKRKPPVLLLLGVVNILIGYFYFIQQQNRPSLQNSHEDFLKRTTYAQNKHLSRAERKADGIPPNAYFEREFHLNMNPALGYPTPEKLIELQTSLRKNTKKNQSQFKVPGESASNSWIERGPNNVGGRTRAILFDPNDSSNRRVFAGGVSGGLWVNNDINDADSSWSLIEDVPGNMSVSCITVDPNDSQIFYLGTGELYTSGSVTGNGIYKSSDGGTTWENVFGGSTGNTITGSSYITPGRYFVQDILAWDDGGETKVLAAIGASYFGAGSFINNGNPINAFLGNTDEFGLYRSSNDGDSWAKASVPLSDGGNSEQVNNIELAVDNSIWLSTTRNYFGDDGGRILKSTDGVSFSEVIHFDNLDRTELETSGQNAQTFMVLAEKNNGLPVIYKTTDGFATYQEMALPEDADNGISSNDFTRGQAFYDLVIEMDPEDDNIVYVGGIDMFRSDDGGDSYVQISKWSNNPGLSDLNVSLVHADHHSLVFRPGNSNQAVIGTDGGVFYGTNLKESGSSLNISSRNNNYNVTQFYYGAMGPDASEEFFLGGTQDNGTPYFYEPSKTNPDSSQDISGGDGAYCFVNQVDGSYLITNYVYNNYILLYYLNTEPVTSRVINSDQERDGDFINPGDLDSNQNILYMNGSNGAGFQIHRYSNLDAIPSGSNADKSSFTNGMLTASPSAFKVSPFNTSSTTLYIGTEDGKLLKITGANTDSPEWESIGGASFLGSVSDIEFGISESQILLTFSNYGVDNVWYSANGGVTWSSKEGNLPDLPVKAILQNPGDPNEVILGTELGVWKTSEFYDSNPNWVQSYNGMKDVKVTDLQLRKSDNTVLATTYGRGIFTGVFENDPNGDPDGDGIINAEDNCDFVANLSQEDQDGDGIGDTCDDDVDGDGVQNSEDNCEFTANSDQADLDGDGIGDVCDDDVDGDLVKNSEDNCEFVANADQLDLDEDGIGDICDEKISVDQTIPTGISPNGDGMNDTWRIEKLNEMYPNNKVQIFDQNGRKVYQKSSYDNSWGGTREVGGSGLLTVGSYYFVVDSGEPVADFYPEAYKKTGWLYINY